MSPPRSSRPPPRSPPIPARLRLPPGCAAPPFAPCGSCFALIEVVHETLTCASITSPWLPNIRT
eukprot:4557734-Prymnesium_polylepis.1